MVLVFFVLLSMFLAILDDSYGKVREMYHKAHKNDVNVLNVMSGW